MKIKTRVFVIALLFSILPLSLVSTVLIFIYHTELNRMVSDHLCTITKAQVEIIDSFFNERNMNLSIIAEYDILKQLVEDSNEGNDAENNELKNTIEEILRVQRGNRDFSYSITALNNQYQVVACTEPVITNNGFYLGNIPSIDEIGNGIWFSHILEAGVKGAKRRCLVAVKLIRNDQGDKIGYLVEELSLDFFENLRLSTNLAKNDTVYITDGTGGIISAGTDSEKRNDYVLKADNREEFTKAWANRDLSSNVGVIKYKIGGKTYLSSYGGFENAQWQIISSICPEDILNTNTILLRVLSVVVIVIITLLLTVNLVMQRMLTYPLEKMLMTFSMIHKSKDFSTRITDIPKNELGVVADEINALFTDIESILHHQEESIRHLKEKAERDSLTELFNKNTIYDLISMKIENAHVHKDILACVFLDIDDFKSFNTNYGHAAGDRVLCFIAGEMQKFSCDNAGRIGGDEFIMCLDRITSTEELDNRMNSFVHYLRKGIDLEGNGTLIPIYCSVGVAVLSSSSTTYEDIMEAADQAMYQVKNSTKNDYYIVNSFETVTKFH